MSGIGEYGQNIRELFWRVVLTLVLSACVACSAADKDPQSGREDYYEFTIPWDHPGVLSTRLAVNARKAQHTQFQRVLASEGGLIFEDGSPARFYGVAVAVSKTFPPTNPDEIKRFVNKLKGYGVNLVRLTGLDYPRLGLFQDWLRDRRLNSSVMTRFDLLVAEIRNAGLYYSISINDVSAKIQSLENVSPNAHKVKHKRFNFVQIFDESVANEIAGWYRAFVSHKNEFSNVTYAEDPANVYITAINEDSIFNGYFGARGRLLSAENKQYLQKLFNIFLTDKYSTTQELRKEWRQPGKKDLLSNENLESGNVTFPKPDELTDVSRAKFDDVIHFLYEIDSNYANLIKAELDSMGFTGLFSVTNNWYGLESLKVNADIGDIIDMHGYFDHPIRKIVDGKSQEIVRCL